MPTVVTAAKLWDGKRIFDRPILTLEDGRIQSISSRDGAEIPAGNCPVDFPGATLAPSFFDVHIHGAFGHDVMEATASALDAIGRFLAAHGTGGYLATTVAASVDETLRALSGLARLIDHRADNAPVARPIGIHLEGPFLSHLKRGVHPPEHLQPADIALFDRLFDAGEGHVRLMTLAPELPGAADLAAHATRRGVRVSVGHSNATAAETGAVVAAGAVSATHTFNAMRPLDHREPGILGVVLSDESLYAELICDSIHTTPEMVKIWSRCKGPDRAILVTDAMSATGMPDGDYRLGSLTVTVANGRATSGDILAGSVLTLDRALANFLRFTGASLEHGLKLLTANPAAMTGLAASAGHLAPGLPANFVAVNPDGTLAASFLNGKSAP